MTKLARPRGSIFVRSASFGRGGILPVVGLLLLGATRVFGQANTGRITGTVTDATGGVAPGAQITIIAVETNRSQEFVTDSSGRYASGPLQVGSYRVEAQMTGFKHLVRDSISLQVQETAVINLELQLGEMSQEIKV